MNPVRALPDLPSIFDRQPLVSQLNAVRHRQRQISLAIEGPGHNRNGSPWNDLTDKYHASPDFRTNSAPDIKTQVDLVKVAVKRKSDPEDSRLQKPKSDQADE